MFMNKVNSSTLPTSDLDLNLLQVHSNTNLPSKIVLKCAHSRIFFKPQSLTSGSLAAPQDIRMYSTSFERSTNFLQHKILKEGIAALLR